MGARFVFVVSVHCNILSQIGFFKNSLFILTGNVTHPPLSFKNIFEARFVKVPRTYRLGNRFSKFVWHDYLILIPDLLKGLCAEVSMECGATLRYALQLRLLGDMHSDMIGLKNLWSPNYFYGHRWLVRTLCVSGTKLVAQYLRLPDDGAKTPKLVVDW